MNLTSSLLVLALLGMDDPTTKPAPAPKASAEMTCKADGKTLPKTTPPDRILQGVQELKQVDLLTRGAAPRMTSGPEAAEAWPMTLKSAIRIGLDNSEVVRVIAFGAQGIPIGGFEPTSLKAGASVSTSDIGPVPIVIARLNADADPSRFNAEVMAHVRSVEQVYWVLAFTQVQLGAAEQAVRLAQEVVNREQAELQLCHGTDVAEAAQRLEQFNLDLMARTSDVVTAERQLRFILGLPPADNRRIIPVTPALEARLEPVWDTCVDEMLERSPDIVQRKTAVRKLRDALAIAGANGAVGSTNGSSGQHRPDAAKDDPSADTQGSSYFMLPLRRSDLVKDNPENRQRITQQEAELEQTIRRQVNKVARFFLEIDANHKQFQTAKRTSAAAAARLDAQRAYYEEGRITVDRFFDAVSQYVTAVGTEAQYKATYNTSIVALKEAKGTLLADYGIVVAEGPKPTTAVAAGKQKRIPTGLTTR
jgi:hypothetical protein